MEREDRADQAARLEHVEGLRSYGMRRKFADEHKEVPLKDLARLGGCRTEQIILTCYQASDLSPMRRAQQRRQPLRDGTCGGD